MDKHTKRSARKLKGHGDTVSQCFACKNSPQKKRKRNVSPFVERPKILRLESQRVSDTYCWICHKLGSESICDSCPRVYHKNCLAKLKRNLNQLISCECQMKTVDVKNEDLSLDAYELKKLLQYVMERAIKEDKRKGHKSQLVESSKFCQLFQTWHTENDILCKIMDLDTLIDNMNGEEPYLSTGQFFLDVKWIYHNCCILYGSNCEISETALKLQKNFQQELTDLEACSDCYHNKFSYNSSNVDFFTTVCRNPHPIVWAKLKGSPYWPAKCLKIQNGHASVKFFGTHDRSNISVKKCYKISQENPIKKAIRQSAYQDAMHELSTYVNNYGNIIGPFQYFEHMTPLEDDNTNPKSHNRKGQYRQKNPEQVSWNKKLSDVETNIVASFGCMENVVENESNQIIEKSTVEDDPNTNIVCHMTFSVEEPIVSVSELNNPEEFTNNFISLCSTSQASLSPNISSSASKATQGLFPVASVLPSTAECGNNSDIVQNSVDFLNALPIIRSGKSSGTPLETSPVITSVVSMNESPSNRVSNNINSSPSFNLISNTVPESGVRDCSHSCSENVLVPNENVNVALNDPQMSSSSSVSLLNQKLQTLFGDNSGCLLDEDESEEDIEVIKEDKKEISDEELMKKLSVLKNFKNFLIGSKRQINRQYLRFQMQFEHTFMMLWLHTNCSRFGKGDIETFISICNKYEKEMELLKKAKSEAEKKVKELNKEVESCGRLSSQKQILKDSIIQNALLKIQNKNDGKLAELYGTERLKELEKKVEEYRTSENHLIEENKFLSLQLEELQQKLTECSANLKKWEECSKNVYQRAVQTIETYKYPELCDKAVQADETYESPDLGIHKYGRMFTCNKHQDSSQSMKNVQDSTGASVQSTSIVNVDVVQRVYEQTLFMSESTSVVTNPSAGVVTASAVPSSTFLPVVIPSNCMISPSGPVFLDAKSSNAFLNSL